MKVLSSSLLLFSLPLLSGALPANQSPDTDLAAILNAIQSFYDNLGATTASPDNGPPSTAYSAPSEDATPGFEKSPTFNLYLQPLHKRLQLLTTGGPALMPRATGYPVANGTGIFPTFTANATGIYPRGNPTGYTGTGIYPRGDPTAYYPTATGVFPRGLNSTGLYPTASGIVRRGYPSGSGVYRRAAGTGTGMLPMPTDAVEWKRDLAIGQRIRAVQMAERKRELNE